MNERVSRYRGTCEALAKQFVGQNGAELDDLVQEGLLNVWLTLERGVTPSAGIIENRMRDWVRWLGRQTPIPYEQMLPLETVRDGRHP